MIPKILIVDDEKDICDILVKILSTANYICDATTSLKEAKKLIKVNSYDVIISDLVFSEGSGMDLLTLKNDICQETMFVLITAYGSLKVALDSLTKGAFDYIPKPFKNTEVLMVVDKAIQTRNLIIEKKALRKAIAAQDQFGLIYKSHQMREIMGLARKVATSEVRTLLIEGETGVGKEVLAKAIHKFSSRADKPFVEINCATLPDTLLESELFGYEKGAFTGAVEMKQGLLEIAMGGTVLMDEIGEISPLLQAKLLRFVEDRTFFRVGGTKKITADVRLIASTNKNLDDEVKNQSFRSDLFYRLKVISFRIPPLRDRKDDILAISQYYLDYYNHLFHKKITKIKKEVKDIFTGYHWPGNVRELKNLVERIALLTDDDTITVKNIPLEMLSFFGINGPTGIETISKKIDTLESMEKKYIEKILKATDGNRSKTALLLGINRKTLWEKIKRYKITL
ncbi:MAG: sigma-54-dependent Fis family transcriptional regulator [Spirochaetes bacterium]|nr:sigma-54-dependent Fis family transcriptional regulator [Spirochaetota bacterium]